MPRFCMLGRGFIRSSDELAQLRSDNTRLETENRRLRAENTELKRQLAAEEQLNNLLAAELDKMKK